MTTETKDLLSNFPEINPANYGDDEVNALNAWGIAAHTALETLSTQIEQLQAERVAAAQPVQRIDLSRLEPFVHGIGKAILREFMQAQPVQQPLTDERIRLEEGEWPIIALGKGLVEVAEGWQGETHALIFGRNGSWVIGAPTQPNRSHLPGETLAVVTFENVESLDVVAGKLQVLREKIKPMKPAQQQLAVGQLFSEWYDSLPYGEPSYRETFEAGYAHRIKGDV